MSDLDDETRETLAYWIRQWRHAVRLQLDRISTAASDADWNVDVDFLHMAVFRLVRACEAAGYPMEERLQVVARVRHEVEHHDERDAEHTYFEGEGTLSLWTVSRGRGGQGERKGAIVEVIDETRAAIAHADTVLAELPSPPSDPFANLDAQDIETLAGEAAHAIEQAWQQETDQSETNPTGDASPGDGPLA